MGERELLDCPFCGGTDSEDNACQMAKVIVKPFKSAIGKTAYRVECGCGGRGPSDLVWGKAIAAWNTRAAPSVPAQEWRGEVLECLNGIAPAVENLACHQEQCDIDGVMVKVSRQALDEVVTAINTLACMIAPAPDQGGENG